VNVTENERRKGNNERYFGGDHQYRSTEAVRILFVTVYDRGGEDTEETPAPSTCLL
jgi:hypothetical protein